MKFDTLKENFSIPQKEEEILTFWEENQVFEKSMELAKDRPHFVFYEGPPTANGRPGIHHVISRTVKDLVCRYKAMRGFRVDRKGGWDTHGLPVEIEVEKMLKLDTKAKVIEYGVEKFNRQCRTSVFKYLDDWNTITRRLGYWLDLDDAYVTLHNKYIETVWWILKNFWDRDLIYRGYKTLPSCPRCETGLSSHEVAQGYEEVQDPSIFVKLKAADGDFSYLVWTTTPWTLPSNAALCMHPEAVYAMVEYEEEKLVLAEPLIERIFGEQLPIIEKKKGSEFLNRKYEPLFDFYKDHDDHAFFVINADFVTLEDGTGIVHIAPGFGADDYEVGKKYGLPVLQAITPNGIFKDEGGKYAGMFIKDADPVITKDLKDDGKLFRKEIYVHNYPFCWRCHSPLVYIAQESWYIKTTQFQEQLIKNNNAINWHPDDIRSGRMLNWLENNVDWALSRERFWGTPLPIWICENEDCDRRVCIGSIEELHTWAVDLPDDVDLHKPMMDEVRLKCECGGEMRRVPEVIDVWFDSGAMPYAQWHYPFENKDEFERKYPADFISEAIDQTRGWFYSLLAISTLLFDQPPFKNVVVLEFILDKDGKKMSKHKGNVVDPFTTIDQFGADPVRWYLVSTSNPWMPTRFDLEGLAEVVRKYFDTLRNTYSFFALYANIDDVPAKAEEAGVTIETYLAQKAGEPNRFDRWIISKYNSLIKLVTSGFDNYEITRPVRAIQNFVIDELSNWYVRNNRRRFWTQGDDPSKMRAYLTLYRVLAGICQLSAPVSPLTTELIWKELMGKNRVQHGLPLSVHMSDFPTADDSVIDTELEENMDMTERIVSLGRAARSRKNLKVRQPLARLLVSLPGKTPFERIEDYLTIIRDELNVKEVVPMDDAGEYVKYAAKLNFKLVGPRLGDAVKEVGEKVTQLDSDAIEQFLRTKELTIETDDRSITLKDDEIEVIREDREGFAFEGDGLISVALATDLTDDLIDEGFAREIVNKIQNMRKSLDFDITDRVAVRVRSTDRLKAAARRHDDFIRRETLANTIEFVDDGDLENSREWSINGEKTAIAVARA